MQTIILAMFMLFIGGIITAAVFAGYKLYSALTKMAATAEKLAAIFEPMLKDDAIATAARAVPVIAGQGASIVKSMEAMIGTMGTFNQFMFNEQNPGILPMTPPYAESPRLGRQEPVESRVYAYSEERAAEIEQQAEARKTGNWELDPRMSEQLKAPVADIKNQTLPTPEELTQTQSTPA